MPSLGNLWYQVMLKDMTDAELNQIKQKLQNLGVSVDTKHLRSSIEAAIGATPFNATVTFGNARASLDAALAGSNKANVEVIASKLHDSINAALDKYTGKALIVPKTKDLRKAVNDALLSAGFEINIGKVKGLTTTINNALGSDHNIKVSVDPKKLADAIDKAVKSYKGGTQIPLEAKEKILHDSIRKALKSEKFPIKVIVDKAEAQDAVRQALQAAGLQNSGFTASDKRAWDAQSRRMEAQARVAAQNALAQRRLAGAHNAAQRAAESHIHSSISLGSAMRGNIRIAGELGPMLASAYSVIALKNFMQKVVEIGGELEKQKLAMSAILGDKGMANTITSQINTLAVKSPFGMLELNQYAKQLTAFQIPYNELYDTMKRMADVSAAVGVDMGRIILAYGQVRAAKFLKGTELRQFTEANIPLIDMLAQRFTKLKGEMVSAGDIMDMISNKEVSFEDVKAVLWELTGEGGKFYNMQEVLSESVQAKWKNLADAIDLMYADIAESTSGPLKGLAEILTELTTQWSTIAWAITNCAAAFGLVKVTSLLTARSLDASGTSALKAAANSALLERRNANLARGYRDLTRDERKALQTSIGYWQTQKSMLASLSGTQFRQLAMSRQITAEEWKRMIALGRLSDVQKKILVQTGVMTQREIANIRVLSGLKKVFLGVGNAVRRVGRALGTIFLNPMNWAMAAVGAVAALWQRNSEEMQKAKEIGDNVATSAIEGFKNLKSSLETIKPSEGMTDVQLTQGIEQMQQLIKDYSPTPIEDINNALVAQDGHIRTLVEQYEILRERITGLKDAYYNLDNNWVGKMVKGALKATDGGNWFTGLFDDSLAENAKDYTNALGEVLDRIAEYSRKYADNLKNAVIAALNADEGFRKATSGMASYDEKLKYLAENSEKYQDAAISFNFDMINRLHGEDLDYFSNAAEIKADRKELISDTDKFIADFNSRLQQHGINPFAMTDQQKTEVAIALKSVLSQMEGAGEDAKALIAKKWEEAWDLSGMIMEDKIGPSMQEKFRSMVAASSDEAVKTAAIKLQYEGYNALSPAEKELVKKLMTNAQEQTMTELEVLNGDMQKYLSAHPLSQLITLSYASDKPSELATELVRKHGYPGLTDSTNRYVTSWSKNNSVYDARNAAQSALQAAKNELDAAKKAGAGVEAAQKKWDEVWGALEYLGWTDLTTSNKHGKSGSQKDEFAEALKQRFKDIKDAYAMFKEWAKLESKDAAFKRVGNSGLFATLAPDKVPQTVDEYLALIDELEKDLKAAGIKGHNQRETLANDLVKERFGINKDTFKEQLQLALDKVSKEAERQLADWNLFDKIRKATGNQDLAMNIAFGMNADAVTNYPTMIKKQFNDFAKAANSALTFDTATPETLTDAPTEVQKAWEDATKKLQQYAQQQKDAIADIVSEYQSLQDKLAKIDYDRDEKIRKVNESDMSAPEKAQYIQRIKVESDYQKFTQSADYLKFFSGIYSLTMDQAQQIGDKIRLHLDQRLQAGKISAEDYYKEIERINQQLNKLRNVKSDAMTFLTGGVKGLNQKNLEKADSDVLAQTTKVQKAEEALAKAKAAGNTKQIMAAEVDLNLAKQELTTREKIRDAIVKDMQSMQNILDVANLAANIAGGISDGFNAIKDMAEALGADTDSGAWADISAVMETLTAVTSGISKIVQSTMNGDIGGILGGVFSTIATPVTIWSKLHDQKLQKQIEGNRRIYDLLETQLSLITERLTYSLGGSKDIKDPDAERDKARYEQALAKSKDKRAGTLSRRFNEYVAERYKPRVEAYEEGGVYAYQRQLMMEQKASLEAQRKAEASKKNSDSAALAEYDKQIASLQQKIKDFAEETAKNLYGIDIKGWASQIGDALVEAFAKGEDAAEAFNSTVADIMKSVVSKVISVGIVEPAMKKLQTFLFGDGSDGYAAGEGGAFGHDFTLQANEIAELGVILKGLENTVGLSKDLYDTIDNATGGMLTEDFSGKNGLSAGIQGVTEDTADLLASYINGMRGDLSMQVHEYWPKLLNEAFPGMRVVAEAQLDIQRQIAGNTHQAALAAEKIAKSNDEISRLLVRVTQGGDKFYIQ